MENEKRDTIRIADLFGGVGGFRLGIEKAIQNLRLIQQGCSGQMPNSDRATPQFNKGVRTVFYSDSDKYAVQTYNKNFKENHSPTDIRTIKADSIPDIDWLCGGFPCQAFSIAGKRRGFEDTRGTLFFEIARIIKAKRPKLVFLENVKGLLNHNKGETFSTIIQTLEELGYNVQWMVLNSKFFGVPQNRERVFIIGSLRGERRPEILPFRSNSSKDNQEVAYALDANYSKGEYDLKKCKRTIIRNAQAFRIRDVQGVSSTLQGSAGGTGAKTGLYAVLTPDRLEKRQNGRRFKGYGESMFTLNTQDKHGVMIVGNKNPSGKGQSGQVCSSKGIHPTINCGGGNPNRKRDIGWSSGYLEQNMKIRRLTPTECERLQGFPDGWTEGVSDTQRYKQMGNAVTVNVIEAIARKLLNEK